MCVCGGGGVLRLVHEAIKRMECVYRNTTYKAEAADSDDCVPLEHRCEPRPLNTVHDFEYPHTPL